MVGNSTPPFYLVWCEDGGEPRRKHTDQHNAEQEAKRLSRECPGRRFYVVAPIFSVTTQSTVIERFDASDDIPF